MRDRWRAAAAHERRSESVAHECNAAIFIACQQCAVRRCAPMIAVDTRRSGDGERQRERARWREAVLLIREAPAPALFLRRTRQAAERVYKMSRAAATVSLRRYMKDRR